MKEKQLNVLNNILDDTKLQQNINLKEVEVEYVTMSQISGINSKAQPSA